MPNVRLSRLLLLLVLVCLAGPARALHFDIEIRTSGGPVAGSRIVTEFFGDLGLAGRLPIDSDTGYALFPGYFSDFEGGTCTTDDPGFQAFPGHLSNGEALHFRGLDSLRYWDPLTGRWGAAPAGVQVVLFGAVPPDVLRNYLADPAGWAAEYAYWRRGTRFSSSGISGPLTAAIARAGGAGAIHAHLDWMITAVPDSLAETPCSAIGMPPAGAYMVTLQLWSTAEADGVQKYLPSQPVRIVFEYGISEAQLTAAVLARTEAAPQPDEPDSSPAGEPRAPWDAPTLLPWGSPARIPPTAR